MHLNTPVECHAVQPPVEIAAAAAGPSDGSPEMHSLEPEAVR